MKPKPVIFSPDAQSDLRRIADYISKDNPQRALSFVEELQAVAENIANAPKAHPSRSDIAPGLRMAVRDNYVILFRIRRVRIEIARILHGARDLPRAFRD